MPASLTYHPKQNRILAALPVGEFARVQDGLELVYLELGQLLYDCGDTLEYVYFPVTCIVSLIFTTQNGSSAELAMTGRDGLVGIPLVLGGDTTTHRMLVQGAGAAYRLKADVVRWELDQGGCFQHLALRYIQALMTQMAQSVVCNRHHSVDQQLCRWLLLSLDQLPDNQLKMTQELIANMLGVRREAVTEAAGKLQAANLIRYSRGVINVIDRPGLEARVCECYAIVKAEYARLFLIPEGVGTKRRARPILANLRKRAEARLQNTAQVIPQTQWDTSQLIHELQVHQIELEMHNEELRQAYDEADALRVRYADIYDFSPVGYFTLDALGVILDLNLAGAILLGIKYSQKSRSRLRFANYVIPEDQAAFNQFVEDVLHAKSKKSCLIGLVANHLRPQMAVKIEAVPDENELECRMVVMEVPAPKIP